MEMPNSSPSNNINLDDIFKFLNNTKSINSDMISKLIKNKDQLIELVNECKNLFTKEQLEKIEKGISDLNDLLVNKHHQNENCNKNNVNNHNCYNQSQTYTTPCVVNQPVVAAECNNNDTYLYLILFFLLAILIIPNISCRKYY